MPARTYRDLRPTFPDRGTWTTPHVLRHRAQTHAGAVYLDCPEEDRSFTYAEIHDAAARVAATLASSGGAPGERLLVMLPNSSMFIRTWLGSALAGMVEVPINTAYRGQFLEHQASTVKPKLAVIDGSYAERFVESRHACSSIERFWVAGPDTDAGIAVLREAGWEAEPWDALEASDPGEPVDVSPRDLASIFFTSGTTGPSKGVMMPQAQMYFFADECVSLTRLTDADTYMVTTPLFHGNAQFLAAYPALVAGARFVLRSRFSASRWIDQVRASGATVTNFLGVMMDFVFKQEPRPDDADNDLRCIFAAPTAYSIIDEFKARFGVEAFVEVFGLTETSMPILSPYGEDRPPGAAGLAVEDWFDVRLVDPDTDEEVAVGELGELAIRTKVPWTCSMGYYAMPEVTAEAWRNLWFHTGDGLRRDADGLVLLRGPPQGRPAPPGREHLLLRGGAGPARAPGGHRVRRRGSQGRHRGRRGRGHGLAGRLRAHRPRRAVGLGRDPDAVVRGAPLPRVCRRAPQNPVGAGPEGQAPRAGRDGHHPRPRANPPAAHNLV